MDGIDPQPEDLHFTDDVLYRHDHLFRVFYPDTKPRKWLVGTWRSTRWSRFKYRMAIYRDRVRGAWAVLRGRASADY